MTELKTVIGGYDVELETWTEDGEERSECFVMKGDFGLID